MSRELRRILGLSELLRPADPGRLHEAFDSMDRLSVSSVGVRTTYSGRGTPSYRIFVGSGVDHGLRETDTAFGSLGHAMVQASDDDGTFTAGVATGKGKYWETRYTPLRQYNLFVSSLAERYWFPPSSPTGQLLPQLTRGARMASWPNAEALAAELDFALIGTGWRTSDGHALEALDLRFTRPAPSSPGLLPLELVASDGVTSQVVWRGEQSLGGEVTPSGTDLVVQRGFAAPVALSELLSHRPPTLFFADGTTVHGSVVFDSRARTMSLPRGLLQPIDWSGVDPEAETPGTAAERGRGRSIHEALESVLCARPNLGKHRWVVRNDGPGEIADYIVIECAGGRVHVGLWHAKSAHGNSPAVRVMDLQEVIAQAIKSRRWITEVAFWNELGARLNGRHTPRATLVEGHAQRLNILCGEYERRQRVSFARLRPVVIGHIGIAQPGLSSSALAAALGGRPIAHSAIQSRELLAVLQDSVSVVASVDVLCSD